MEKIIISCPQKDSTKFLIDKKRWLKAWKFCLYVFCSKRISRRTRPRDDENARQILSQSEDEPLTSNIDGVMAL